MSGAKTGYVSGFHAVESILVSHPDRVLSLHFSNNRRDQRFKTLQALAENQDISVSYHPNETLERLAQTDTHQGVIAQCKLPQARPESALEPLLKKTDKPFLLILDGVTDPHNLGACLRTANAVGVTAVIVPKDNAVGITPTVLKTSCGAALTLPFIQVTNLVRTMQWLQQQKIWLYGTDEAGTQSIFETDLTGHVALVMGAEGQGLRRLTAENCDSLVQIPMLGDVPSLNVSVATGVCLYEALRQRN